MKRGEAALYLLATALHRLRRQDRTSDAGAIVDHLAPSDFMQTEHVILVGLAKDIQARENPFTLESLDSAILENDPAGFIAICREQLEELKPLSERKVGRALEQLFDDRRREPEGRDRKRAAALAQDVLAGKLSLVEASPELCEIGLYCGSERRYLFSELRAFFDDIGEYPVGPVRQHWNSEALQKKDRQLAEREAATLEGARSSLEVIASWSVPRKKLWRFW